MILANGNRVRHVKLPGVAILFDVTDEVVASWTVKVNPIAVAAITAVWPGAVMAYSPAKKSFPGTGKFSHHNEYLHRWWQLSDGVLAWLLVIAPQLMAHVLAWLLFKRLGQHQALQKQVNLDAAYQ